MNLSDIEAVAQAMAPRGVKVRVFRDHEGDVFRVRATQRVGEKVYGAACAIDRVNLLAYGCANVIRNELERLFYELKRAPEVVPLREVAAAAIPGFRAALAAIMRPGRPEPPPDPPEPEGLAEARANQADPFGPQRTFVAGCMLAGKNLPRPADYVDHLMPGLRVGKTAATLRAAEAAQASKALASYVAAPGRALVVDDDRPELAHFVGPSTAAVLKATSAQIDAAYAEVGIPSGRALRSYLETKGQL